MIGTMYAVEIFLLSCLTQIKVSVNDLRSQGASNLLSLYNDSPSKLITSLFPEYNLKLWLFQNVPKVKIL